MGDWIRLTPDGTDLIPLMYQWRAEPGGFSRHWLESGGDEMELLHTEALAFARQLPEVKALVEALRWWLETGHFLAGNAPRKQIGIERSEAALVPFDEAPNA